MLRTKILNLTNKKLIKNISISPGNTVLLKENNSHKHTLGATMANIGDNIEPNKSDMTYANAIIQNRSQRPTVPRSTFAYPLIVDYNGFDLSIGNLLV